LFHLLVPGGTWLTTISSPISFASFAVLASTGEAAQLRVLTAQ
jgi:hypothetical protein